jgi:nucleotide-binding universal stress UspA family protein
VTRVATGKKFRVVVATDGSAVAGGAVAAAVEFPWPEHSSATGIVARGRVAGTAEWSPAVWAAIEQGLESVAAEARRVLRKRWPDADVVVSGRPPVSAILAEARGAKAIVVGSRGHGVIGRLLLGSVSRGVVRSATCPTLVVKGRARGFRHFVAGVDGSANSRRATAFLASLGVPSGARATLIAVVEPVRLGSLGLMPSSVRAALGRQIRMEDAARLRRARRELATAMQPLRRAGWRVRGVVRRGVPQTELLAAASAAHADVVVVGARGVGGVERLLLGSVAQSILSQSGVPVLVVR